MKKNLVTLLTSLAITGCTGHGQFTRDYYSSTDISSGVSFGFERETYMARMGLASSDRPLGENVTRTIMMMNLDGNYVWQLFHQGEDVDRIEIQGGLGLGYSGRVWFDIENINIDFLGLDSTLHNPSVHFRSRIYADGFIQSTFGYVITSVGVRIEKKESNITIGFGVRY